MHSRVKAAHVRCTIPYAAEIVCELHPRTAAGEMVAAMVWSLADFLRTLDRSDRWLNDSQKARALRPGRLYQLAYQALAAYNLRAARCNYKVRPK